MPIEFTKGDTGLINFGVSFNFGEQVRASQRYVGPSALCRSNALGKGAWGTGDLLGYQVENSQVNPRDPDEESELLINYVWPAGSGIPENGNIGTALPEVTWQVTWQDQNVPIEQCYPFSTLASTTAVNPITGEELPIYSLAKSAVGNPVEYELDFMLAASTLTAPEQVIVAQFYGLLRQGTTHKLVRCPVYSYVTYFWVLPSLSAGGFCVASPAGPAGAYLPSGHDWLRNPDQVQWTGAYYQVTSSYIGSPNVSAAGGAGGWSEPLYPHL